MNFVGTLAPRLLVIALPFLLRVAAPHAASARWPRSPWWSMLVANVALQEPLNVAFQWRAADAQPRRQHGLARRLPALAGVRARGDVPRAARRGRRQARPVPRAARRRAARLRDVPGEHGHPQLREPWPTTSSCCATRHVDFVIAYDSYTASRHTNEIALLAKLAAAPSPAPARPPCGCTRSSAGRATSCTQVATDGLPGAAAPRFVVS